MQKLTTDEIKASLTMPDLLTHYGIQGNRKHRIPCPLHNGKDNNFAYTDQFFHCFVCGESGDVISFVQKYKNISFKEALLEINNFLHAGNSVVDIDKTRERAEYQAALKRQAIDQLTSMIGLKWHYLDVIREKKPKTPDDEPCAEWLAALGQIDWLTYKIIELHREICEKWGGIDR